MTIRKDGLIAGSPQSLNDLVDRVQAEIDASVQALEALAVSEGTPVNAVAAQGTLTISGVVIDGETFTIGGRDVFCGDAVRVYQKVQILQLI